MSSVTRPLDVSSDNDWVVAYRKFNEVEGEEWSTGELGAAYTENGLDWHVVGSINEGEYDAVSNGARKPSAITYNDEYVAFCSVIDQDDHGCLIRSQSYGFVGGFNESTSCYLYAGSVAHSYDAFYGVYRILAVYGTWGGQIMVYRVVIYIPLLQVWMAGEKHTL